MNLCFASGDAFVGLLVLIAIFAVPYGIYHYIAHAIKARAARKEAEFQQQHPELWRQRELLKLEKERLETEKKLAEGRAKQEATRRNVGLFIGIGRGLGWW